jgi:threonine dehydratase
MSLLNTLDIDKAHLILQPFITQTPLVTNEAINSLVNAKVYFKLENLQKTGSFKIRGATYKISLLSTKQKQKGIVTYSSGNHAQAVALASLNQGIEATIVMPDNAPKIKIKNTKSYGVNIVLYNPKTENREAIGNEIALETGKTLIKPYDDIDIITGQGTVGKEITEQLKEINTIPNIYLCCVSGGGLIAGSSYYIKSNFPEVESYSVEPENFNDTLLSLKRRYITSNKNTKSSICDALLVSQPGEITFKINQATLKGGLDVSDWEVRKTIKILAETLKVMVEPGGAVAAAALLTKKIEVKNKIVVVMLSGGNIDSDLFSQIITKNYE